MVALLFPFGSPEKDALTLIASKVEDNVKDPGVVDAKAEPARTGRSTSEPPRRIRHDVRIIFVIPRLPGLLRTWRSESSISPRHTGERASAVRAKGERGLDYRHDASRHLAFQRTEPTSSPPRALAASSQPHQVWLARRFRGKWPWHCPSGRDKRSQLGVPASSACRQPRECRGERGRNKASGFPVSIRRP